VFARPSLQTSLKMTSKKGSAAAPAPAPVEPYDSMSDPDIDINHTEDDDEVPVKKTANVGHTASFPNLFLLWYCTAYWRF